MWAWSAVRCPASFEMEALKAQAAAERTYVYYQLAQGRKDAHPDADFCTDHTCCSAYLSETAAKEKWAADFAPWNTASSRLWRTRTVWWPSTTGNRSWRCSTHPRRAGPPQPGDVWSGDLPYLASVAQPGECRHRAQLLQHSHLYCGGGKRPSAGGPPGDKTHRRAGDVVRCGDGE